MKGLVSTITAVALLLGLGALAVLALPGAQVALNPVPVAVAAPLVAPEAPDVFTQRLNMVALPLDASASFLAAGYTFDAKGLANYIGTSVIKVSVWLPASQTYKSSTSPFIVNNFALQTGGIYMVTLNNSSPTTTVFSIVGSVPPASLTTPQGTAGRVEYALVGGNPCLLNHITVPLDRSDLLTAKLLATAVGNVTKIQVWDATNQVYISSTSPFLVNNFTTKIGYPYVVCVSSAGNGLVWP